MLFISSLNDTLVKDAKLTAWETGICVYPKTMGKTEVICFNL